MGELKTTTRGSSVGEYLPYSAAIKQACQVVAYSPEGARYLEQQTINKMTRLGKLEEAQQVLKVLADFRRSVEMQQDRPSPQSNEGPVRSDFQNFQHNFAQSAIETIKKLASGPIKLDFALNQETKIIRGFSSNGNVLPAGDPLLAALDLTFNAWLAERNMISKGSRIYECDSNGDIKKDAAGNRVNVDAVKLSKMISDPEHGFQKTLSSKGVNVTVEQHRYPEQRAEAKQAASAQAQREPDQEAPTSGSGMGAGG
ncbi:substrate of the Dot/Icm secretion system [Legionella birminghamensis]|uniref:Dot/Icm secretion system substrate n=1 Tax=Legionella birminghamensis TaxID=28083 RepID=A0A378IDM1_9GAMM|nr:hypothetical protein [Legionella birminghamensis]KTC66816.1 substrate of the Dot/Icm secretion system [Legionella birminghamensis]STX33056.1 Dot/Icm secretion system substrate [Legionella birminghamensis]